MATILERSARVSRLSPAIASAVRTVATASLALEALSDRLEDATFIDAFETLVDDIVAARGRVIVAGMGKSGLVGRKITATLTSTGTPALYLHAAEAGHGDLGMVTPDDIVVMITRSGETTELAPIIAYCRRFGVRLVAITTRANSTAARAADLCIRLPSVREACPNLLAPTTSTTLQNVFGDALAVALIERRGFSADDFYKYHPNGQLGAQLLKVADLMSTGTDVPRVASGATLLDATTEMTRTRFGGTAVVDAGGALIGAFTDGDLRRTITSGGAMDAPVDAWMTREPMRIAHHELASEALRVMQNRSITMLFVMREARLAGVIHMHDLLRVGIA